MIQIRRIVVVLMLGVAGLVSTSSAAAAGWAENPPQPMNIGDDRFYNYDFGSVSAYQGNIDWPVGLVFWNNASVSRVKSLLNSPYDQTGGEQRAALVDQGYPWVWDGDAGRKTTKFPGLPGQPDNARHYRIYADAPLGQTGGVAYGDDRIYNLYWSYWVFGTTHWDYAEFSPTDPHWFGNSENAEDWLVYEWYAKGYAYTADWNNMYNYEPYEVQGDHIYDNNGFASFMYIG